MTGSTKTVLVTGGSGYVGATLAPLLLEAGFRVKVLGPIREGGLGLVSNFAHPNFSVVKGDIRKHEDLERAIGQSVDVIVHLAAVVGSPACKKDPELSRSINVEGTRALLEASRYTTPIIFSSTIDLYGNTTGDICTEETPLNPLTEYGEQKRDAEMLIQQVKQHIIFRFATGFGISPRMRLDTLPNDFTFRAVKEKSLIVYEKDFVRSFVHVRDMARAILFGLQNFNAMYGEVYNVGDASLNMTKEQLCVMLQQKVQCYVHYAEVDKDPNQRNFVVSFDKIHRAGFTTTVSLEQGVDELIKTASALEVRKTIV